MVDPWILFWITASCDNATAVNPNGTKTHLPNDVSTFYIYGNPAFNTGLWNLRNLISWLIIFLVVPFNKIPLFSKDLITLITSFISLFANVNREPLLRILSPTRTRKFSKSFVHLAVSFFIYSFLYDPNTVYANVTGVSVVLLGSGTPKYSRNPPNCTILDKWVFDNSILSNEPFAKAWQSLKTCVSFNNNFYRKLVSSLEPSITFDETFKVTSVQCFLPDFVWIGQFYIQSVILNHIMVISY